MTPARDPKQRLGFALLETSFGERVMDIWGAFRKHVVEHFGNLLGAGRPDGARPNLEESRAIFIDKNRCLGSRPPFSSRRNAHEGHEVLCFICKNGKRHRRPTFKESKLNRQDPYSTKLFGNIVF